MLSYGHTSTRHKFMLLFKIRNEPELANAETDFKHTKVEGF